MAKRFIDTGFLDQKWIRKLSPEKKIFVIYLMLKCDNGGIIDLDLDDAEFWIGKKIGDPLLFLPEGFLIPVIEDKYFIPKFLKWQYPNFPNSKVHQQRQGIKILTALQVFDLETNNLHKKYLNFTQTLPNSQVIVNDNGNVDDNEKTKEPPYKSFYREQWESSSGQPLASKYQHIIKYILNLDKNVIDDTGEHILKLKKQLSYDQFITLNDFCSKRATTIKEMIDSWLNTPSYSKGKVSVYAVLRNWAGKAPMAGSNFQEGKKPLIQTSIGKQ
jgi:hypothetical protein